MCCSGLGGVLVAWGGRSGRIRALKLLRSARLPLPGFMCRLPEDLTWMVCPRGPSVFGMQPKTTPERGSSVSIFMLPTRIQIK